MKRQNDIEALIHTSKEQLITLQKQYSSIKTDNHVTARIKVFVFQYLTTLRPVLDYIAADIAELVRKKDLAYTPYFPCRVSAKKFEQDIQRDFPHLKKYYPEIFEYLLKKQPFKSINNIWWKRFNNLTNHNKHNSLSSQTVVKKNQMTVDGNLIIRGGFIQVSKGATINGKEVKQGFKINSNDRNQIEVNEYFGSVVRSKYYEVNFSSDNEGVISFLNLIHKNVSTIYGDLNSIMKKYNDVIQPSPHKI